VFKGILLMLKVLAPMFLALFLNNVEADDLAGLNQDLKLLKSNLLLLSDKIVLTRDELVTLDHIDTLFLEVEREIKNLGGSNGVYHSYLSEIEKARSKIMWNQSGGEFNSIELSEKGLAKLSFMDGKKEKDKVDNKLYLYDAVACPDDYSLQEWRELQLKDRRINAVRCTIELNKNQMYKLYTDYLDQSDKDISGEILIVSSVGPNGNITIKNSKSDLPSGLVAEILGKFSSIKMPVLDSSDTDLQYSFKLKSD
jgi:hypothetical protein